MPEALCRDAGGEGLAQLVQRQNRAHARKCRAQRHKAERILGAGAGGFQHVVKALAQLGQE